MAQNYQLQKTGQEIDDLLQKIDDLGPASSGSAGTMSAQDKAKLDDIETGAESNVIEGIVLGETSLTPSASKTVTIPVDSEPTEGSENPVASGGVYDALGGKMDKDTSAGENDIAVFNDEGQVVGAFDVNEVVREGRIKQTTGQSTTDLMSQKAVTDALDAKASKNGTLNQHFAAKSLQVLGRGTDNGLKLYKENGDIPYARIITESDLQSQGIDYVLPTSGITEGTTVKLATHDEVSQLGQKVSGLDYNVINGKYIKPDGTIGTSSIGGFYTDTIHLKSGETITYSIDGKNCAILSIVSGTTITPVVIASGQQSYTNETYTAVDDVWVVFSGTPGTLKLYSSNSRIDTNEENIEQRTLIDKELTGGTIVNGQIESNNTWNLDAVYRSVIFQIFPGNKYVVKGNDLGGFIGILSSTTIPTEYGQYADFSQFVGGNARIAISPNEEYEFIAPADAAGLYVRLRYSSGVDSCIAYVKDTAIEYFQNRVNLLENNVNLLEVELKRHYDISGSFTNNSVTIEKLWILTFGSGWTSIDVNNTFTFNKSGGNTQALVYRPEEEPEFSIITTSNVLSSDIVLLIYNRTYDDFEGGELYDYYLTSINSKITYSDADCVARFVQEMNNVAKIVGMENSVYYEPAGYPNTQNVTTAKDLMRLAVYVSGIRQINDAWGRKTATIAVLGSDPRSINLEGPADATFEASYEVLGWKPGQSVSYGTNTWLMVVKSKNTSKIYALGEFDLDATPSTFDYDKIKKVLDYIDGGSTEPSLSQGSICVCELPKETPSLFSRKTIPALYARNENTAFLQASTTKIMTVLVASIYGLKEADMVKIHESDEHIGTGQLIFDGDIVSVRDLFLLGMLPSSNTAMFAIARVVGKKLLEKDNSVIE